MVKTSIPNFKVKTQEQWVPHLLLRLGGECRRKPQGGVDAHRAKAGVQVVEAWVRQLAEDQLEVAAQLPDVIIGLRKVNPMECQKRCAWNAKKRCA
jgi:hypothetical protein